MGQTPLEAGLGAETVKKVVKSSHYGTRVNPVQNEKILGR